MYSVKKIITHTLLNLPGWHTRRKIVVIESDDWGSIRMPSKKVYDQFLSRGVRVDRDPYCRYDSLATPIDLEALFEVLMAVKDRNGNPAVLTANSLVANPDFEKIRKGGFTQYYYEPLTETLKRDKSTENSFEVWKQGMQEGVFHPQFHGREHLNIKKWMRDLQLENSIARIGFDLGTFGLTSDVHPDIHDNYMGAFNSGLPGDIKEYNVILNDGTDMFEKLFGFRSLSFIPTTYTCPPDIEPTLKQNGIKFLQGMVHQRIPVDDDKIFRYKKNNFTGYRSKQGLIYITRNAYFEPSQSSEFNWLNNCLKRIEISFLCRKPAIISTHRLNFIGAINEENRNRNLNIFSELLKKITLKYPDVEFMSSDRLGQLIDQQK